MASIKKRPNGQWRARYRDDSGREHARHFARKVDAQRWLDEVTAQIVTGAYADPKAGRSTFDAWFRQWSARQVWVPTTAKQADRVRRSVTFGDVTLGQLRESHLQQWVKQMQGNGLAASTIHTRLMPVRASLKAAVRDRRISSDPSAGLRLPRKPNRAQAMDVATSEQVGRLLAAADPGRRAFIALCAFAGLRKGEVSGVKVGDLEFLRRQIAVERQVQARPGGTTEERSPKYESGRTVFASDELLAILARHVDEGFVSPSGWLFTSGLDSPISPGTVGTWWRVLTRQAGVEGVTIHSLRHYFASGLIAEGCDVVTVQRALGHKAPSITLDTYSHLWPSAEDRTRQASGRLAAAALVAVADRVRTEGDVGAAELR
jgi:integrase